MGCTVVTHRFSPLNEYAKTQNKVFATDGTERIMTGLYRKYLCAVCTTRSIQETFEKRKVEERKAKPQC